MNDISELAIIHQLTDIEESRLGSILTVSPGVCLDAFVKIKFAGGIGDVSIGANSIINSGCVLYSGDGLKIGQDVLVSANVTFAPVNHAYENLNLKIRDQGFKAGTGIRIGNDVWIGAGCVILNNTIIEDGCVVAANSTIKGTLLKGGLYTGLPIRRIGERS
jgi:virginiamycin A acetyltransferase